MIIVRSLRAKQEVFDNFAKIAEDEGRKQGKMFEILVNEYMKSKGVDDEKEKE